MKITNYRTFFPWVLLIAFLVIGAGTIRQLIGPSAATSAGQITVFRNTDSYSTTNSPVTIDGAGTVSNINELDVLTVYSTNGVLYLQKSSAPTAGEIGGTVGSITNVMVRNLNGALIKYWSDGTSLYSQEVGSH